MNGRRQREHRERDPRESLGAGSERQSAKRQEAAWHRSAENNTEIKTLGIDRERERTSRSFCGLGPDALAGFLSRPLPLACSIGLPWLLSVPGTCQAPS